jgi:hypothetical protein
VPVLVRLSYLPDRRSRSFNPVNTDHPTADETSAIKAFDACYGIPFRVANSQQSVFSDTEDAKVLWERSEAGGLQSVLTRSIQITRWDGSGTIHAHRHAMTTLRTELTDAGMPIGDQTDFPQSAYDDTTFGMDPLCSKFVKYEMRRKPA